MRPITYDVMSIFNSIFFRLDIRQLQIIFNSQIVLEISRNEDFFIDIELRLFFVLNISIMSNCRLC